LVGRSAYSSLMMEAARTSETSVDNHFTRQYNPEDSSEHLDSCYSSQVSECTLCHIQMVCCVFLSADITVYVRRESEDTKAMWTATYILHFVGITVIFSSTLLFVL
jgi:hypothetical protein